MKRNEKLIIEVILITNVKTFHKIEKFLCIKLKEMHQIACVSQNTHFVANAIARVYAAKLFRIIKLRSLFS